MIIPCRIRKFRSSRRRPTIARSIEAVVNWMTPTRGPSALRPATRLAVKICTEVPIYTLYRLHESTGGCGLLRNKVAAGGIMPMGIICRAVRTPLPEAAVEKTV